MRRIPQTNNTPFQKFNQEHMLYILHKITAYVLVAFVNAFLIQEMRERVSE